MKKVLYLGLDPSRFQSRNLIHFPVIRIEPNSNLQLPSLAEYSHIIFTSKSTVEIFFALLKENVSHLKFISIGPATFSFLKKKGFSSIMAEDATQEGIMKLLETITVKKAFLPCSSLARKDLADFLAKKKIAFTLFPLYQTVLQTPFTPPEIDTFHEVVFTSPSTVDGFFKIYPKTSLTGKEINTIGPITKRYLQNFLANL